MGLTGRSYHETVEMRNDVSGGGTSENGAVRLNLIRSQASSALATQFRAVLKGEEGDSAVVAGARADCGQTCEAAFVRSPRI